MNRWLLMGSALVGLLAIANSLLGEKFVLKRFYRRSPQGAPHGQNRRAQDDSFTRNTLRIAWHALSLSLVGYSGLLFHAARHSSAFGASWLTVMRIIGVTFTAIAFGTFVLSRGRHPVWVVLAAVAASIWLNVQ